MIDLIPNNPLINSIYFPLCQRGTEGDFCFRSKCKSPLAALLKSGEYHSVAKLCANDGLVIF